MHNPAHLPDPVLGQGSKMDIELGYAMRQFSTRDLYSNVLQELYSKKSPTSRIDQIIYLGFRSVKKERKNGTDYHGQEKKIENINYTGPPS